MIEMNSLAGKQALSLVRKADYAHAGEEEAVDLVFKNVQRNPSQRILDVGSGLGATAEYIRRQSWGKVTGIEINRSAVVYANETYERNNFITGDAAETDQLVDGEFDFVVSFNAFYAFQNQPGALDALSKVAKHSAQLMIFDYVDRGDYHLDPILENGKPFLPNPLHLDKIESLLERNGWHMFTIEPLHPHFTDWYATLVDNIRHAEKKIRKTTPEGFYDHMLNLYTQLYNAIHENRLGGAIVRANHGKA